MKPAIETRSEQAAAWVIRRDAGLPPAEEQELSRWLAHDPANLAAWEEALAAWQGMTRPEAIYKETVLEELARWETEKLRRRRRTVPFATAALLAAAAAIALVFRHGPVAPAAITAPSFVERPQRQALADGSQVQLNAAAEIEIDYTPTVRRILLLRGEAHFEVAKESGRPFVVSAGKLSVEALGTAFSVRLAPDNLDVLVTDGKVQVATEARSSAAVLPLAAGQLATIPISGEPVLPASGQSVTPGQIDAALAWRTFRVEFTGTPLSEAVKLFNEKSRVKLALADPSLGELRVSGTYWVNNAEGFSRLLENGFSLRAERTSDTEIALRPVGDRK